MANYDYDPNSPWENLKRRFSGQNMWGEPMMPESDTVLPKMTPTGIPSISEQSKPVQSVNTPLPPVQNTLSSLPAQPNEPKIFGIPANDLIKILGTAAGAVAPDHWSGRLGVGLANIQRQQDQDAVMNRRLGMEESRLGLLNQQEQSKMQKMLEEAQLRKTEEERLNRFRGLTGELIQLSPEDPTYKSKFAEWAASGNPDEISKFGIKFGSNENKAQSYIGKLAADMYGKSLADLNPEQTQSVRDMLRKENQNDEFVDLLTKEKTGTLSPEEKPRLDAFKTKQMMVPAAYIQGRELMANRPMASFPGAYWNASAKKLYDQETNQPLSNEQLKGMGISYIAEAAPVKATASGIRTLENQRAKIIPFIKTTESNLNIVDELSQKVDRTNVPVINRWLLAGKKSIAGDVEVAKFDAAVRTAINEYSKVTSSVTGGGVTSDTARKEVETMLNAAQTPDQIKGVTTLLRQEMRNRQKGLDYQLNEFKKNLNPSKEEEQQSIPENKIDLDKYWK